MSLELGAIRTRLVRLRADHRTVGADADPQDDRRRDAHGIGGHDGLIALDETWRRVAWLGCGVAIDDERRVFVVPDGNATHPESESSQSDEPGHESGGASRVRSHRHRGVVEAPARGLPAGNRGAGDLGR